MARKAVEETGLIPRSIIRTLERFRKQLFPEAEKLIIQEFRISRSQFLVSIKCLLSLIIIPFIVNYSLKNFLLIPLTENFWNTQQSEIFLNSYQQDRAFTELKKFQEKLYFEYLLNDLEIFPTESFSNKLYKNSKFSIDENLIQLNSNLVNINEKIKLKEQNENTPIIFNKNNIKNGNSKIKSEINKTRFDSNYFDKKNEINLDKLYFADIIQQKVQKKTLELAIYYNNQSIIAVTNLIGDFITFLVISLLLVYMKPQISILKSFLTESIYSLNDTKKSFLLILGTDLLVGFHSPRGWEICLQLVLQHFGFPENKDFIFLFVASFPVLLDTVFKYWIFRYLNKISPSTVATYHSMIE